jgi:hypothetical protein
MPLVIFGGPFFNRFSLFLGPVLVYQKQLHGLKE